MTLFISILALVVIFSLLACIGYQKKKIDQLTDQLTTEKLRSHYWIVELKTVLTDLKGQVTLNRPSVHFKDEVSFIIDTMYSGKMELIQEELNKDNEPGPDQDQN